MNMPKSRDIQAKIPLPQAIWNFGYITENGVNSNYISRRIFAIHSKGKKRKNYYDILGAGKSEN